ncbi:hypothetical protein KY284_010716 [Solanum tuberosum]|nr:hypothetical protein KY284_010716 [Solanum tuberosum]
MGAGGKVVYYGMEAINQVYRLLNHDLEAFTEKDCASGAWLASKLCPGKTIPWPSKRWIFMLKLDHEG